MRNFDTLMERLGDTYQQVYELEWLLRQNPGDRLALASLESIKYRAQQFELEWEEASREKRVDVCRYRLIRSEDNQYSASNVSYSLIGFQSLISNIFAALTDGPRVRGRLSDAVVRETSLNLGFAYPGSFAYALYVPGDRNLFGGKFDETVDSTLELLNLTNTESVRGQASRLGIAVIRKVYQWSESNFAAGFDLGLTWTNINGLNRGENVTVQRWGDLISIIGESSQESSETQTLNGVLVGIETAGRDFFHIVVPGGNDYKGTLAMNFDRHRQYTVNKPYRAIIETKTIEQYATETTKETHELQHLELT